MNLSRPNKKRFIKHRAFFFINTNFNNIKLINLKPDTIIENNYYQHNNYIEKEFIKN